MLKLTNLTKIYRDFTLDCSLEVRPGTVTGLIGANGAGKSTTFKAVLGLISHDGGEIEIFGNKRKVPTVEDKRRIGVALADSGFSGELSVKDVTGILAAFYPAFDAELFRRKARELSLPEDKKIKDFSTGMKAKLRVLSALCHKAELLILDEPTAGLDVLARDQILDLLREYIAEDDNRSILISSHISGDLEQLCDDFYMIENGRVLCHEETDRLLSDYAVLKVNDQDYEKLDKSYILRRRKEGFGWSLLTDQKRYYAENCPGMVVERITMDEYIMMMLKGEK